MRKYINFFICLLILIVSIVYEINLWISYLSGSIDFSMLGMVLITMIVTGLQFIIIPVGLDNLKSKK